ncbi:glycosyltransferase family 2 protein [Rhodovulum sp. DZ06]|uniref:glycosyltransferase family 2 protein n=1 Tax=Rhodovulum sp. DZ06 TaxID=3425126 RepID=UPI003D355808
MPLFTIVIPCRDAADILPAALASLRAQTWTDWEAICVEAGSSDDTAEVIDRVARTDPRVRRIRPEGTAPGGAALARNAGALAARGEVIAFLDAADRWAPERLARLADRFAEADAPDVVFGSVRADETPAHPAAPIPAALKAERRARDRGLPGVTDALRRAPACAPSNIALRRAAFQRIGGFDSRLAAAADIEWAVRVLAGAERAAMAPGAVALIAARGALGPAQMRAVLRGWREAVETARILGVAPGAEALAFAEAQLRRGLAARALRGGGAAAALGIAALGLLRSPLGFLATAETARAQVA